MRLILIFALLMSLNCSSPGDTSVSTGVEKGNIAPDFTLSGFQLAPDDATGEMVYKDLQNVSLSDFRGKVVFLNLWATWCPACRYEMPQMERMYQDYQYGGLVILAVEVEQREGLERVRELVKEHNLSFPILLDSGNIARLYKITAHPTTFLIGRDGVIQERIIGLAYNWDSVKGRKLIESLL